MNKVTLTTGALAVCALINAVNLAAQDWPQWRGPNRDGKAAGFKVPETWPTQLKQEWKSPIGVGDTTPALVGDKIYAFGRVETDEVIYCLDANTGKTLWQNTYPADYIVTGPPARHPGPRSSPIVADGKVCTLGVGGILSCLDAKSGKLIWRKQSTNDYQGSLYRFDSSMSPIVVDGRLIVHIGGKGAGTIMAIDLASGDIKWKSETEAPSSASPVLMTAGGTRQLVTFSAKSLMGVRLSDGQVLWKVPFEATTGGNATTPIVDGDTVIYTGNTKGMHALKVKGQGDAFTTEPLWDNAQISSRFTSLILKDGLLFGCSGRFFCADAKTGEALWTDDTGRGTTTALVDVGPEILGLTINSGLVVFKADSKAYTELAKIKVADTDVWAHPVVSGKHIIVRDADSVICWSLD